MNGNNVIPEALQPDPARTVPIHPINFILPADFRRILIRRQIMFCQLIRFWSIPILMLLDTAPRQLRIPGF